MQYGDNLKAENERLSQAYKEALALLRTYVRDDEEEK
jgi:hypothetical protein